jgi:hypothetical protein
MSAPSVTWLWRRRVLVGLLGAVAWIALAIPAGRGTCTHWFESKGAIALCYLVMTPLYWYQRGNYELMKLADAITPATDVQVELDDQSVVAGHLTPEAVRYRQVDRGDRVRLDCTSPLRVEGEDRVRCNLRFFRPWARPLGHWGTEPKGGQQESLFVWVSSKGIPDASLLRLERPAPQPIVSPP